MKFRMTAVAVAIAGIAAAPVAMADTVLSGIVEIKLEGSDDDSLYNAEDEDGPTNGDPVFKTGDVLAGIVATQTLNNGLEGYGSLRYDLDALSGAGTASSDSVYVGMKGGFGDLRVGEVPNAGEYGQLANDIYDTNSAVNGGISYTGNFGPATLGVHYAPDKNEDSIGVGAKFGVGGFDVALGYESRDELDTVTAGAAFEYAGASIAAHYGQQEAAGDGEDTDIMAVKVGYGISGIDFGVTYQMKEAGDAEASTIRLDAGYDLGGGMAVKARYNIEESDFDGDLNSYHLLMSKSF